MDQLAGDLIDAIAEVPRVQPAREDETNARKRAIYALFVCFRDKDVEAMRVYLAETLGIPLGFLQAAVSAVIRSHKWSKVPTIAELWSAAREIAGMHREQYHAGRYMPAPRDWPPEGQRHAIHVGQLEPLGDTPMLLTSGPLRAAGNKQLESGEAA